MRRSDPFGQYTADEGRTTQYVPPIPPYPQRQREPRRGPVVGPGGGDGGVVSHAAPPPRREDWRPAGAGVGREPGAGRPDQGAVEGSRPWRGHPQDVEDLVGPNRSGGIDEIVAKKATALAKLAGTTVTTGVPGHGCRGRMATGVAVRGWSGRCPLPWHERTGRTPVMEPM